VLVEPVTRDAREKYWNCLSSVFDQVDPRRLQRGMDLFGAETRFFAVEIDGAYASVLFVTPVTLAGQPFGGVGGVCTRTEFRGRGFGSAVLGCAIRETCSDYPSLMLWTRIPEYFEHFGFVEVPQLFCPAVEASSPMILIHDQRARPSIEALRNIPREYF